MEVLVSARSIPTPFLNHLILVNQEGGRCFGKLFLRNQLFRPELIEGLISRDTHLDTVLG